MKTYVCMLLMMRRRQCAVDDEETAMYEGAQECKMVCRSRDPPPNAVGTVEMLQMIMLQRMVNRRRDPLPSEVAAGVGDAVGDEDEN